MSWQDYAFAVTQVIFIIALIPTILGSEKPALSTSMVYVVMIIFVSYTFYSLGMYFSAITSLINGVGWVIIVLQKYFARKNLVSLAPQSAPVISNQARHLHNRKRR